VSLFGVLQQNTVVKQNVDRYDVRHLPCNYSVRFYRPVGRQMASALCLNTISLSFQ